jgi:Arylsulfotransferase (ASST)
VTRPLTIARWAALAVVCLMSAAPAGADAALQVTGNPALFPSFNPGVRTYVARCEPGKPLRLSFSVPAGTKLSVDGRKARGGSFTRSIRIGSGQAVRFLATKGGRYLVRCLPPDFPRWQASRAGQPQAAWYVVAPCCTKRTYAAIFDTNGVPVWWINTHRPPLDASLLPNGDVVWAQQHGKDLARGISAGQYEEHRLDGRLVRTFSIPDGTPTDRHELQLLPNGDYVVVGYKPRNGVDLSPYGGPSKATVLDALIEEVTPKHKVVWSWNSKDHIGLAETGRWYQASNVFGNPAHLADGRTAYDIVHINAVERYGPGHFLVSLRHTDAIYDVARSNGHVVWKLGGTSTPQSLQIVGDSGPDFGGQHDIRVLPDGTVTLHDNGTDRGRPARALRFSIDAAARTATLVEQIADPSPEDSPCCGSARKLPGGDWVISWGGTHLVTEQTPSGKTVFALTFPTHISYRAFPVLPGRLKRSALYRGMDAMHPRK